MKILGYEIKNEKTFLEIINKSTYDGCVSNCSCCHFKTTYLHDEESSCLIIRIRAKAIDGYKDDQQIFKYIKKEYDRFYSYKQEEIEI